MSRSVVSYALQGGLDLVTPALRTPVGRAIAALNYEGHPRGYKRVDGFERFDGQPKPSAASYWVIQFDAGTGAFVEGETVTAASGGTAECLIASVVESGSFGGSDAVGYLVVTGLSGTFADDDALTGSASGAATQDGSPIQRGAETDANDTTWIRDAIETARSAIGAVPGSGPIRGVWFYGGSAYAFRDNAGGTAGVMHKATSSGWVAQTFGRELSFTSGGSAVTIVEGDTIEGVTSGATATVERVAITSGSWGAGDAAGYLVLSGQTGTFQAENIDDTTQGGTNDATIAGDSVAITLSAGGTYRFRNHNFFGGSNLRRMYFVNGEDRAHEWDGSVLAPITTGMDTDTPTHVDVHRNHLFLAFPGGSLQYSGTGEPLSWEVVTGAGEIGLGQDITGLLADVASVLAIFCRNKVAYLSGSDASDWELQTLANDAGAVADTAQQIGRPIYLDDIGLRTLDQTEAFGDFSLGTLTRQVEPLFRAKRAAGVTAVGSCRVREKDQYRLFWSDGTGLSLYLGRESAEPMPFDLGKTVGTICSAEASDGSEILLFAADDADDAYVYELDAGTSADGGEIESYLRLPFNHVGSPARMKRWHKATLEVDAVASTTLGLTAEFGYANPEQPPAPEQSFNVQGGGGFWNEVNWNDFVWSAPVEGTAEARIDGIGENVSLAVLSQATYEQPHLAHGVTLQFTPRRISR